ncbi:somatostatin receptor type 3-like [Aplysia californica]|uniref:Somatostatin receptor type 3-like n=1 Tax=Aplysia californica TaxID=6500 RepID=A0ABM0JKW3_APLCA|nr:somatostatin receptor type 3-like [Aplysia californica]
MAFNSSGHFSTNLTPLSGSGSRNHSILNPESSQFYVAIRRLQTVMLPLICVFGLVGNSLAVRTFLVKSLRSSSCSLYLAAKCTSDSGFLLSLLVIWLYRVGVQLFNMQGICQMTVFLTYTCGFSSVWFVTIITCENYIRIAHPTKVVTCCTASRAKVVISAVFAVAGGVNAFPLWTSRVITTKVPSGGNNQTSSVTMCMALKDYQNLVIAMTYVDTVFTLILPSLIISIMVLAIVQSVLRSLKRRKRLRAGTQRAPGIRRTTTPQAKMTRFLFAISVIFLLLHTPSHAIRLKMMIETYAFNQQPGFNDHIFHRSFELLYYLNFCNNVVVYLVFGDKFREIFSMVFCARLKRNQSEEMQTECRMLVVHADGTETIALRDGDNGREKEGDNH